MPADFDPEQHGLQQLRTDSYAVDLRVTFKASRPAADDYLGLRDAAAVRDSTASAQTASGDSG